MIFMQIRLGNNHIAHNSLWTKVTKTKTEIEGQIEKCKKPEDFA